MTAEEQKGAHFVVTGGGEPSEEELAAIAVAFEEIAAARAQEASAEEVQRPAAWRRAALLEAIGGRPAVSAADLEQLVAAASR